jgi:hypothetical protein
VADPREEIRAALDRLVGEGRALLTDDPSMHELRPRYQAWYSEALSVVQQLLRERVSEFQELYRKKEHGYTISSWLTKIDYGDSLTDFLDKHEDVYRTNFAQQIDVVGSARARLDSILSDVAGVLEASQQHLRAGGAIAGVVLERHHGRVVENHGITMRKRKPTLADLNQALKDEGVYDVPRWREIQHLTDLRNLSVHDDVREPTKAEVEELIGGVDKVVKLVF